MDFKGKKILVIGDIILDEYIEGTVSRISPEAPIPILDKKDQYYRLGGAANVARNLVSLGASVWIIGRIGEDTYGKLVIKNLMKENINVDLLVHSKGIPTTVKTRYIAQNHQLLRVDHESKCSLGITFTKALMEDLERHIKYFDAVIISDYQKGVVVPKWVEYLCELKNQYGTIITVDTHKSDISCFSGVDCITPNKKELAKMVEPWKVPDTENAICAALDLIRKYKIKSFLVTLSEEGMVLVTPEFSKQVQAICKNIVDVTGAGDTVISVYTLALTLGLHPSEAMLLANKAASIVIAKMGTATVKPEELCF